MNKIIVHIDLNQFFVRCEEIKNPNLVGKPVIIGHTGRSGIVSTCSYAARKFGVCSGMPTFKATRLCPEAIIIDVDFPFYHKKSQEFFDFLSRYTNLIEPASIDECYLDMTSVLSNCLDPYKYLLNLQMALKKQTDLNCSIGVAPTKFLAKMASDMQKPNGLTFINESNVKEKMYPLPIEAFWGIGKKTSPRLREVGINTIGDLAEKIENKDPTMAHMLGKFYYTMNDWIHCKGDDEICTEEFDPKSIGHSTTMDNDCSTYDEIKGTLEQLADMVSSRLVRYKKRGYTVGIVVKDPGFNLHTKSMSLEEPTNSKNLIFDCASEIYKSSYEGMNIRLIGITVSKLVSTTNEPVQLSLWNYEEFEKKDKTTKLINELNMQLSKPLLFKGSELKKKEKK